MNHQPTRRAFVTFLACLLATATLHAETKPMHVYVSVGGAKHIAQYNLDPATGNLTPVATVELAGGPGALTLDPSRKFLYASIRPENRVETLTRDPQSGKLTHLATAKVKPNCVYLTIDKTGKHLLTADYGANIAASYPLNADGSVSERETIIVPTAKNPHSIITDPSNRFAFVPLCGADQVLQFKLEPGGQLTANNPPFVAEETLDGPRHIVFHPSGKFVYVENEKSSSVTAFSFDASTGTLAVLQKISQLPAGADAKALHNSGADLHLTPDGRFLYSSNRGHHSIAGFAVDQSTGKLTFLGATPCPSTPRAFAIDPTGNFLLAAGQGSTQMEAYRINPQTGELKSLAVLEVGKAPAWIEIVND